MIFLGTLFDRKQENEIKKQSRTGLSNAANTFQWALIDGLNQVLESPVKLVNVLPVGTYPRAFAKWKLPTRDWKYAGSDCREIGCVNLPVIKQLMRIRGIKKYLRMTEEKEILIYSAYYPFLKAISRLDHSYRVTLIVTDLPEYYDLGHTTAFRRYLRKRLNKRVYRCMERVDRFVLLTEQMKEPLHVGNRPYVVVEGIADVGEKPAIRYHEEEKAILYTGTLNKQFGILSLLQAFSKLSDDRYRLWICGDGDAVREVEAAQKLDSRIHYYGYVTKAEAAALTEKASVLVNPRTNEGEYTKYSFPSKTMVYMTSGVPVVMYKLDGIPDEYDPYLYYVQDQSSDALAAALQRVCEMPQEEWCRSGEAAWRFIAEKKNNRIQAERIARMMLRELH